jgi:Flp pilus assembly protein TadD
LIDSMTAKLDALAQAQQQGTLSTTFTPRALLAYVMAIASSWQPSSPWALGAALEKTEDRAARRASVIEAARRLVRQPSSASHDHDGPSSSSV